MPSITVENYLKQLYLEQQNNPDDLVPMGKLATAMGVVPGTATSMVKALADSGLVSYEPRFGAKLTKGGEQLALHVLRRHRLLELFLVKVLGLDWSEVHDEAEELEHAISDKVLDRIDALLGHPEVDQEAEELEHAISDKVLEKIDQLLGHPEVDPHGDPIPTAKGKVSHRALTSLAECELDRPVRVARVMDQDPQFLQFVDRHSLKPGAEVVVRGRDDVADSVSIRSRQQSTLTIGRTAAAKILVEAV